VLRPEAASTQPRGDQPDAESTTTSSSSPLDLVETLVELTRLSVDATDPAAIAGDLIERIVDVLGAVAGSVVQVDGSHLRTIASVGMDAGLERLQLERPPAEWGFLKRFSTGAPAYIEAIEAGSVSAATLAAASAVGYRAYAAFPIRDGVRLDAALIAAFRQPPSNLSIDARTLQAIGRVVDISFANQRLRRAAVANEERYRVLFERSPDALIVQDPDGVIVEANPAARELFGEDVVGSHISQLAVIDDDGVAGLRQRVSTDGGTTWAGFGRRLDGRTFPVEIDAARIQIDGVERVLNLVRDTTERDRLQHELLHAQKMEAIGLLVAGVAHELNNPLASILAFSQLIRTDRSLPPELQGQADLLIQEARRTHRIVKGLLDFARQRPPERLPTSLREIVDEVLGLQSYTFGPDRIEAIVEMPNDLPPIPIDRAQIEQVLVNLTLNAAQAIRGRSERGTIRIVAGAATSDQGEEIVRLSVTDDGPGIPAERRSRLFVPFFTTRAPGEGSGLGLSVSFGIVAGHRGTLRHEVGPGGVGTTFVMELPVRPGVDLAPQGIRVGPTASATDRLAVRRGEPVPVAARFDGRDADPVDPPAAVAGEVPTTVPGPRILVLDDEASIRDFLARILRRNGYEPIVAVDGTAALEIVRTDPPDAILCDHRMAGMSGTAFHEAVAATNPGLARRFAFMSGDVLNPELHDFAVARGIVLLAKPFDIETVARTVKEIVALKG
jgi:two-component system NtrC family sensor kinase